MSEPSDCVACLEVKDGCVVLTRETQWPSPGSPGEPPEYDFVCYGCQEPEDEEGA